MGKKLSRSISSIICLMLTLMLTINMPLPTGNRAEAFDQEHYTVATVTVFKVYDINRHLEQRRVLITGTYLKDAAVGIISSSGYKALSNRINNTEGLLQFDIDEDQVGSHLVIEGLSIALNEGAMPTLTGVNRKVAIGMDDLHIQGTNLKSVADDPGISAGYEHEGAYVPMDKNLFLNDETVVIPHPAGNLGLQNIIFTKEHTGNYEFRPGEGGPVTVTVKYTYKDQFRFIQNIVVPGLQMHPNRGEAGDKVVFEAPHPNLNIYDVFFLRSIDGTDPYTNAKKGRNRTFQTNVDGKDYLTVEVPDIPVGEYFVVLTNPVSSGADPMQAVVQELIVGAPDYEKFTVIDANIKSVILNVQPSFGPDTGSRVTISGQFFGTLNIPEFIPQTGQISLPEPPVNTQELLITYDGGQYKGQAIISAQRKIKVIIGDSATFVPKADGLSYDVSFNRDLDNITVLTAQIVDAAENPLKDVVVETQTILTKADASTIVFKERAELSKGYTYFPSKIKPALKSITPDKIQLVGGIGSYKIPEDRMVAIYGSNFMVTRFINGGQEVMRYPVVELGKDVILDKNISPNLYLKVFDDKGREVDGTEGSEVGSKIIFIIPSGSSVSTLGKTYLKVTNPVKNSENMGLSEQKSDFFEFVNPDIGKRPVITSVNPDVMKVDGGEEVIVEGSNFVSGVMVFIDGKEVKPVVRQGDGKKLTFIAPPGREGETQLQVMNPEGGMDTRPFTYVLTYTTPRISSFSPRAGNTGTLVLMKGESFLKPEPTASESSIFKLIGSRIMLEGYEVNEYHRNPATNRIELRDYAVTTQDPLLSIVSNEAGRCYLKLAEYHYAVLLEQDDGSSKFYTIEKDSRDNIILSDGAGRSYSMKLNNDGDGILAHCSDGPVYPVTVENGALIINEGSPLRLKLKTLYRVDAQNNIVGNRVKVLDSSTLIFRVPILEADGYYDVTVINPDTNRDSKIDQQGFYYYKLPISKPEISGIIPGEGSTQGGYNIDILGREFEDNGITKSKVYINGVEISSQNTMISPAGDVIRVVVPAYPGDLRKEKGTDRLSVPLVIVNPDGGSVSREFGFTYVLPSSHPRITGIVPSKGSAAGNEIVEITGTDFRYFEPYDDANRNQVWDADESFIDINDNGRWDSEADLDNPATDWREPVSINHPQYAEYYASPVLPRVYFGEKQAKIVEFSRGYLKVVTPTGIAGNTKVYLVNNDAGISNTVNYSYESSQPRIDRIIPAEGPKQGGQKTEVYGSGFSNHPIDIYRGDVIEQAQMPLIRFGSISNRNIPRDQENSGRIDNGLATVKLEGGLRVEYRANRDLRLYLEENGKLYSRTYAYNDATLYIEMSHLAAVDTAENYPGLELLKVSVEDRRLIVERGYCPEAQLLRSSQVLLKTPSYYAIGTVAATIINPDGGQASGSYTYKNPDSSPRISNITRDGKNPELTEIEGQEVRVLKMNYRSQSVITVSGVDFRENARIQIGDILEIAPGDISYNLPTELTFTLPAVSEQNTGKLYRVLLINEDGAVASSDELPPGQVSIYLLFTRGETSPLVSSVWPLMGPASGGTVVNIAGKDFRGNMAGYEGSLEVYFGGVKVADADVAVLDYKNIRVITPPGSPGEVAVRVENPDDVISLPEGLFTYISSPQITGIVDVENEDTRLKYISVEGKEKIKIKGSGFMQGAQVIFNPIINTEGGGTNSIYQISSNIVNNQESKEVKALVLQSGTNGSDVVFVNSETIIVTTPAGKLYTGGVMVINPDKGSSNIYDLQYELPQLQMPGEVIAEIVHDKYQACDRYIKIHWNAVEGAGEYEVYVIEDRQRHFIGSSRLTAFIYQDIKPSTSYRFVVTAVGNFGSSPPSLESNEVTTGAIVGPPDTDGALGEKTTVLSNNNAVYINIGDDAGRDMVIDISSGELAGAREITVSIPARIITASASRNIEIRGLDFGIRFTPAVFKTDRVYNNRHRDDAGVKFSILPYTGNPGIVSGSTLSRVYSLKAGLFLGQDCYEIDYLALPMGIVIDHDANKARLRKISHMDMYRYDFYKGEWVIASSSTYYNNPNWYLINRMGLYSMMGNR